MNKTILTLAVSCLFVSTYATAADKNWGGFKIGIGIGGQTIQSQDKSSAAHEFTDSSQYTTSGDAGTSDTSRTNQTDTFGSNSFFNQDNPSSSDKNNAIDGVIGLTDNGTTPTWDGGYSQSEPQGYAAGTNVYNRFYEASETFKGTALSSDDLAKSNIFGILDGGYDWMLNDKVVFGLHASLNLKAKTKANATGGGENNAGWNDYLTYKYITNSESNGNGAAGYYSTQDQFNNPTLGSSSEISQTSNVNTTTGIETGNSFDLGGRLGFLLNESTLIFMSGGASAINAKQTMSYTSQERLGGNDSDLGDSFDANNKYYYSKQDSRSDTRFGYYLGAGFETMVSEHLTAKLEYRFADYGKMTSGSNNVATLNNGGNNDLEFYSSIDGTSSTNHTSEINAHSIRATLNYSF